MPDLPRVRAEVDMVLASVNPAAKELAKEKIERFVESYISKIVMRDKEYGETHTKEYELVREELMDICHRAIEEGKIVYDENGDFQYAISPSGKISNLSEFWWLVSQTRNFQNWYKGLCDENGDPLLLWHGTGNEFNSFDTKKIGQNKDSGFFGKGFYLTETRKLAEKYGRIAMPLVVNLRKYVSFSSTDRNARYRENGVRSAGFLNGDPNARKIITGDYFSREIHEDVLRIFEELKVAYYAKMDGDSHAKALDPWSFVSTETGDEGNDTEHLLSEAITLACLKKGYNGVIAENPLSQVTEIVMFEPADIKSLDNLIFYPGDPNIYH